MTDPDEIIFDLPTFMRDVDAVRTKLNLSWKQVAYQSDVSPSTLTHISKGYYATTNIQTIAKISHWANLHADPYICRRCELQHNHE